METETITNYKCGFCWHKYSTKEEALNCEKKNKKEKERNNLMEFELTDTHLKLLKNMYVGWSDVEYGAPEIDPKRPYGNSDVEDDIAEIIKLPKKGNWDPEEETWTDEAKEKLSDLHRETQIALQVVLSTLSFEKGLYKKKDEYGCEWIFAGKK